MQITNFNYNYFITNYNMNFYEKYLKYKTKYLLLKQQHTTINQQGGNDNNIILYNSDFMNLSQKIKDNKKDLFIDIILWIFQDSKYNKDTKKYENGFEFITNSAKLIFNNNNDGFIFIDDNKASKDEVFELSFIIKNIIELQVTNNFNISDLKFNENKKNIYTRINFIKNFFITQENNKLESISQPKQKIESVRKDIESVRKDIEPVRKDIEPVRKETKIIDDFEPNTFFPNDMIVGTFEYIPYKREKDEFSSTISEDNTTINSEFSSTINSEFNTTINSEFNTTLNN